MSYSEPRGVHAALAGDQTARAVFTLLPPEGEGEVKPSQSL